MKNYISSLVCVIFMSGCAIGPLVSHETARTVGDSNHELIGGLGQAGLIFKWNYGFNENLDLGLHLESLSMGIRAKYAFINARESGWSLAAAFGTGGSSNGTHYYGDIIGSYLTGSWEPYSTIRIVHVKNNAFDAKDEKTGQVIFSFSKFEYDYGHFFLGTRYWFNTHWLISLEASTLFTFLPGATIGNNSIVGAALGYRF